MEAGALSHEEGDAVGAGQLFEALAQWGSSMRDANGPPDGLQGGPGDGPWALEQGSPATVCAVIEDRPRAGPGEPLPLPGRLVGIA